MKLREDPDELGPFQFVILLLSLVLLAGIAAEWVLPVPNEVQRVIFYIDTAVCGVFLVDFLTRFWAAPSKLRFMRWGWIDLLASIPAVETLRWGRVIRIVRIVRLLTAVHSFRNFIKLLLISKSRAGIASVFTIAFLVISFGSIGILLAETAPTSNIHTAEDALWWSMVTVTTVGYGDFFPVTSAGRIIASLLMVTGIGLFGALSGVAAGIFLGSDKKGPDPISKESEPLAEKIARLEAELNALRTTPSASVLPGTGSSRPPSTSDPSKNVPLQQ